MLSKVDRKACHCLGLVESCLLTSFQGGGEWRDKPTSFAVNSHLFICYFKHINYNTSYNSTNCFGNKLALGKHIHQPVGDAASGQGREQPAGHAFRGCEGSGHSRGSVTGRTAMCPWLSASGECISISSSRLKTDHHYIPESQYHTDTHRAGQGPQVSSLSNKQQHLGPKRLQRCS